MEANILHALTLALRDAKRYDKIIELFDAKEKALGLKVPKAVRASV